jgi:hypothetical protein
MGTFYEDVIESLFARMVKLAAEMGSKANARTQSAAG